MEATKLSEEFARKAKRSKTTAWMSLAMAGVTFLLTLVAVPYAYRGGMSEAFMVGAFLFSSATFLFHSYASYKAMYYYKRSSQNWEYIERLTNR